MGYTDSSKQKSIQSCMLTYGCEWPMQSTSVKDKARQTLINRYGVDNIAKIRYRMNVDTHRELSKAEVYNNSVLITADPDRLQDSRYYMSLCNELDSCQIDYVVAFPWDDTDALRAQLRPKSEVFVDNCELYRLTTEMTNQFLLKNDYRPLPRGQVLCLGHVYNGQVIQVMTFGRVRNPGQYYIKLIRAVTAPEIAVIGGYNALSSSASTEFGVDNVMTTADRTKKSFNKLYPLLGLHVKRKEQTVRHIMYRKPMYDCGHIVFGT